MRAMLKYVKDVYNILKLFSTILLCFFLYVVVPAVILTVPICFVIELLRN
jgi:hypothetical protein